MASLIKICCPCGSVEALLFLFTIFSHVVNTVVTWPLDRLYVYKKDITTYSIVQKYIKLLIWYLPITDDQLSVTNYKSNLELSEAEIGCTFCSLGLVTISMIYDPVSWGDNLILALLHFLTWNKLSLLTSLRYWLCLKAQFATHRFLEKSLNILSTELSSLW